MKQPRQPSRAALKCALQLPDNPARHVPIQRLITILAALATPALAAGQGAEPPTPHESLRLTSSVMGETRRINVYVPPQYDACPSQRFPLLLPDGGLAEDFPHVANTVAVRSALSSWWASRTRCGGAT